MGAMKRSTNKKLLAALCAAEIGARFGDFFFNSDAYTVQDPLTGGRR